MSQLKKILFINAYLLAGIIMLYFGSIDKYNNEYSHYKKVNSVVNNINYTTEPFKVTYTYYVDNIRYNFIEDHYSDKYIEVGDKQLLYYNPDSPNLARFDNTTKDILSMAIGIVFILVWIPMVLLYYGNLYTTLLKNIGVVSIITGITFTIIGILVFIYMSNDNAAISLSYPFEKFGLIALIPVVFIIGGILTTLSSFRFYYLKNKV